MEEISPRILSDDDLMAMFVIKTEENYAQGVLSTTSTPQHEVEEDVGANNLVDDAIHHMDTTTSNNVENATMAVEFSSTTEPHNFLDYLNDLSPTTNAAFSHHNNKPGQQQQQNIYFDALFAEQQRAAAAILQTTNNNSSTGYTIRHIQGFTEPVEEEQPGGSGNKHPLPLQVIELTLNEGSIGSNIAHEMLVNVFMVGYEHYSNSTASSSNGSSYVAQKKVLDDKPCAQSQFVEVSPNIYRASFSNIICTHTSHHCGKSLCLRFTLVKDGVVQTSLDSSDFKTLTQRAWQKRKEKSKLRMSLQQQNASQQAQQQSNDNTSAIEKAASAIHSSAHLMNSPSSSSASAKVINIVPCIGPCTGGQLVKITGLGFNTTASRISVKFGDKSSRHVYSVSKNTIICETPDHNSGTVDIKIALDGRSKHIESKVSYTFIRPSDSNGVTKFLQQVLGADHRFLHKI